MLIHVWWLADASAANDFIAKAPLYIYKLQWGKAESSSPAFNYFIIAFNYFIISLGNRPSGNSSIPSLPLLQLHQPRSVPRVQPSTASRLKIQKIKKVWSVWMREREKEMQLRSAEFMLSNRFPHVSWVNSIFKSTKNFRIYVRSVELASGLLLANSSPSPSMRGVKLGGWRDPRGANLPVTDCHPTSTSLSPSLSFSLLSRPDACRGGADTAIGVVVYITV